MSSLKDATTGEYLVQNDIFADVFNFFLYEGKPIIDPESLVKLDTKQIAVPYGSAAGAKQAVQKYRDVIKSVTAMTDRKTAYLVLAVEAQANIHYAMPVRIMVYDALQYAIQVQEAITSHKNAKDYKGTESDEYLSGFLKEDRLLPVVTLVIYFDGKKWDGPMSVHEMFEHQDEQVLSFVPDFRMNLIAPAAMQDEDFEKFSTTLKEVLSFIKYSKEAEKLVALVNSNENFRKLGRKEINVLNSCVGANLPINQNEEVVDVCEAIRTLEQRAAEKAVKEFKETAEKEAKEVKKAAEKEVREAKKEAKEVKKAAEKDVREAKKAAEKEVKKAAKQTAERLLRLGKLSYEEIAEVSQLPIADVKSLALESSE